MCLTLPDPANDDFRPAPGDAIARHFATRGLRRGLTAVASCFAAAILAFIIVQSVQPGAPQETTQHFRV